MVRIARLKVQIGNFDRKVLATINQIQPTEAAYPDHIRMSIGYTERRSGLEPRHAHEPHALTDCPHKSRTMRERGPCPVLNIEVGKIGSWLLRWMLDL
eukprot:2992521-Amphidinium_carterae.1